MNASEKLTTGLDVGVISHEHDPGILTSMIHPGG